MDMLYLGKSEIDITPEVGTALAGYLTPRNSTEILDPLKIKAIVLNNNHDIFVYVVMDLALLPKKIGEIGLKIASEKTGIPPEKMMWTTTHTHTAPYTMPLFEIDAVNYDWLETLPLKIAQCIVEANKNKENVEMKFTRGFHKGLAQNRRIKFKDGREVNEWLLTKPDYDINAKVKENNIQSTGAAGVIDPEVLILAFENNKGLQAVMFQSVIHAASYRNWTAISADYPAVVADRISKEFQNQPLTLYVPGACGDIDSPFYYDVIGNNIADIIIERLADCKTKENNIIISSTKREVTVPVFDYNLDYEDKFIKSQYTDPEIEIFRNTLKIAREKRITEVSSIIQAWRIGRFGFVSLPGEPFVNIGLNIKEKSPFEWTFPVEIGGDYIGYLITKQAWEAGGYESIIGAVPTTPTPDGVKLLEKVALDALNDIY